MRALSGGGAAELILNTPNTAGAGAGAPAPAIPGLPADAVVEVPSRVTPDGVAPLPQERPAPEQLALLRQVKDVERLVVAATSRDTGRPGRAAGKRRWRRSPGTRWSVPRTSRTNCWPGTRPRSRS